LAHHGLGRATTEALAEPDRVPAGVPQRQRGQARGARDGLAGQLGHVLILPDRRRTLPAATREVWTSAASEGLRAPSGPWGVSGRRGRGLGELRGELGS